MLFQKREDKVAEKLHQIQLDIANEKIACDSETDATLKLYDERVKQAKDEIIKSLLNLVTDIHPKIHHNFKVRKEVLETGTFKRPFDPLHSASSTPSQS